MKRRLGESQNLHAPFTEPSQSKRILASEVGSTPPAETSLRNTPNHQPEEALQGASFLSATDWREDREPIPVVEDRGESPLARKRNLNIDLHERPPLDTSQRATGRKTEIRRRGFGFFGGVGPIGHEACRYERFCSHGCSVAPCVRRNGPAGTGPAATKNCGVRPVAACVRRCLPTPM